MIIIPENTTNRKKVFLEYWNNELMDFFNMASNSRNYKEIFKALIQLEKAIEKESDLIGVKHD